MYVEDPPLFTAKPVKPPICYIEYVTRPFENPLAIKERTGSIIETLCTLIDPRTDSSRSLLISLSI